MTNSEPVARPTDEPAHTPGPWRLKRDANREEYSVNVPPKDPGAVGYLQIASLNFGFDEPFESQQHANARLIAAAPDLLAALKKIVSDGDYTAPEGMKRIAQEAIDKAEGRS